MKKTKIVATLGLVSDKKGILENMIEAGMNVARLNFSHGSYEWHGEVIDIIRQISREKNISIGILADLQGPRIRTLVQDEVPIEVGELVLFSDDEKSPNFQFPISNFQTISNDQISNDKKILLDVKNIVDDIEVGNEILIEDGIMKVVVREKNEGVLLCEVIDGGVVKNHKGVNIPDAKLNIDPITEKDERDLEFCLKKGVDFVAMSFVSSGQDIENLREKMKNILGEGSPSSVRGWQNIPQIIAKIERKEAIKNLDDIIEHTDAVMVARGDLGIEVDASRVAVLQKEIIKKSLENMKPVIVATQMLNSMIENPRPTRAEVSDVTNAVVDHADAVMLSGESASGKYPLESVSMMAEIIKNTEESPFDDITATLELSGVKPNYFALVEGAYDLAKKSEAVAIVMASISGLTARIISHYRPEQPMFVVTNNFVTYHQLSLLRGVESFYIEKQDLGECVDDMLKILEERGDLQKEDTVVMILGSLQGMDKMQMLGVKTL
jgi:pyruvate kinase